MVRENPNSSYIHLIGFKRLVEETFHYSPHRWLAKEKNKNLSQEIGLLNLKIKKLEKESKKETSLK